MNRIIKLISTSKVSSAKLLFNEKPINDNTSYWFKIYKSIFVEEDGIPEIANRLCNTKAEEIIKILKKGKNISTNISILILTLEAIKNREDEEDHINNVS